MKDYAKIHDKETLERWYLRDHLTMAEIGKRLGISRQAVLNRINRCGIDKSRAERFEVRCDFCGELNEVTRKRYKSSEKHFCPGGCYFKYLRSPEYREWRDRKHIEKAVLKDAGF